MPADDILLDAEDRMEKALQVFSDNLRGLRTGTASAGLVNSIRADYYGSPTPLKHMATISIPDPRLIVIKPYDPGSVEAILKALQKSDLGINPQSDGRVIRLTIPPLSQETRQRLASRVRELAEEARVAVRNIRRDANRQLDREQKESIISEDDCRVAKKEIQEFTDTHEEKISGLLESKNEEIMKV